MYKDINNQEYDYIIIGTSLTESILSAYLAKKNQKILHFDVSKYYGGDCKNFNLKDLNILLEEMKEGKINDVHLENLTLDEVTYLNEDVSTNIFLKF